MLQRKKGSSTDTADVYNTFSTNVGNTETVLTNGFTIQEAIEHIGFGRKQLQIGICAGIIQLTDGVEILALSILGPVLLCHWQLSTAQEAMITTVVFAGFFIGAVVLGYFADVFGRKKSMMLSAACLLYYGFLSSFSPNYTWLLVLRFFVGIGVSGSAFCTSYYLEFLPVQRRGKLIMFQWGLFPFGGCITTLLAMILIRYSWRIWLATLCLPALVFLILSIFLPTSPRYELACGRKEVAYDILKTLAKSNGKEMPPGELLEVKLKERGQLLDLFKPGFRLTSVLLGFSWITLYITYYGITLFTTELIKAGTTCKSGLNQNDQLACSVACRDLDTGNYLAILWTTFAETLGAIIAAFLLDVIGRRKTLLILISISTASCFLLCICMSSIPMIAILFCGRGAASAASAVIYIYTAEVYPTEVRGLASGVGSGWGKIGSIITPFLAQVVLNKSLYAGLSVYGSVGLLSIVCIYFLPIETKEQNVF